MKATNNLFAFLKAIFFIFFLIPVRKGECGRDVCLVTLIVVKLEPA